jgi:hypothetical protein
VEETGKLKPAIANTAISNRKLHLFISCVACVERLTEIFQSGENPSGTVFSNTVSSIDSGLGIGVVPIRLLIIAHLQCRFRRVIDR